MSCELMRISNDDGHKKMDGRIILELGGQGLVEAVDCPGCIALLSTLLTTYILLCSSFVRSFSTPLPSSLVEVWYDTIPLLSLSLSSEVGMLGIL